MKPLARIASGGELSRIMLALKTLASTDAPGKTLIFDEVDAGIGGAVADVVGGRLQRLGRRFQVLCITHLPQIAAYGSTHYRIAKNVRGGRTLTEVATRERDRPGRGDRADDRRRGGLRRRSSPAPARCSRRGASRHQDASQKQRTQAAELRSQDCEAAELAAGS